MNEVKFRGATAADLEGLMTVLSQTELFPSEMLPEMIAPFLNAEGESIWLTGLTSGVPVALCYAEPEQLADRVWNMLALAVLPKVQGQGIGGKMVAKLEADLIAKGQRMLIVDTSGDSAFERTRRFYEKHGYEEEARIRDYWSAGEDKVTYRKKLG